MWTRRALPMGPVPPRIRDWVSRRLAGVRGATRYVCHLEVWGVPAGCSPPDFDSHVANLWITGHINRAGSLKVTTRVTDQGHTWTFSLSVGIDLVSGKGAFGAEVWTWPWQYATAKE